MFSVSEIDKLDYPEGIYMTKQEFIERNPSDSSLLIVKERVPEKEVDTLIRRCLFYYKQSGERVKKAFAIVYNGNLYFRKVAIVKNKNKKDRSYSKATASKDYFVLVLKGGDNLLYTEAALINHWQVAIYSGLEVNGIYLAPYETGKGYYKNVMPVVWDYRNEEFNIFRNCNDFNMFLQDYNMILNDCKKFTFENIVEIIDIIK